MSRATLSLISYEESIVKYPQQSQELLKMANDDQEELRNLQRILNELSSDIEKERYRQKIADNCHKRAARMFEILEVIGLPSVGNIGKDAAEAVSLLALHSYVDEMKKSLTMYEELAKLENSNIYKRQIPSLSDRIMIAERRKQRFGTNWFMSNDGRIFLIRLENFNKMNSLRAEYGLEAARKPRNLSVGADEYPLGSGLAEESDQKDLTDEEYAEYTRNLIRE